MSNKMLNQSGFFFFLIRHTIVCVLFWVFLSPKVHCFIIVFNGNRATQSNVHKMTHYTVGRRFYGRGWGCYWNSLRWLLYDSLALKEWQNAKSQHVRKWSFDLPHSSATSCPLLAATGDACPGQFVYFFSWHWTKGQDKRCWTWTGNLGFQSQPPNPTMSFRLSSCSRKKLAVTKRRESKRWKTSVKVENVIFTFQ